MLDEQEALRRSQSGEESGYAGLFERYQHPAWRLAYAITGNQSLADDVTQEAFIQAFRAIQNVRLDPGFGPWFYTIVANRARRTMLRSRWWFPLDLGGVTAQPDERAAAELERAEWRDELWQQIQKLDVDLRTVIGLRYVLDMGEAEMATVLGVPRGTVKSRLHRARQTLQQELKLDWKEADALC